MAVPSIWMAVRQGPSGFDRRHHRPQPGAKGGEAAAVAELVERLALVRGDEPAAVLAQAGRTVALQTGLVRKFA